jgi:hypothetical protein
MSSLALVIFFAIPFFLLQNIAAVFGGKLLEGRSKTIRGQPVKRSLMHESQAENQCNSRQLEKIMAQVLVAFFHRMTQKHFTNKHFAEYFAQ